MIASWFMGKGPIGGKEGKPCSALECGNVPYMWVVKFTFHFLSALS